MNRRRLLVRAIVTGACLTAAVAIGALVEGRLDATSGRILLTTTAISVFGLLFVPAQMLLDRGTAAVVARTSVGLTSASFGLTLLLTWGLGDVSEGWLKLWGVVSTLALALAQASAVEARRRDTDTSTVRAIVGLSMLTGAALAVLGVVGILGAESSGGYFRLLGVVGVLDVLALVVITVLRRGEGTAGQLHRLRVNGRLVEVAGRDFAAAAARAIREAEHDGTNVTRLERV